MSPPIRTVRPDFRSIYRDMDAYEREQATVKMDSSYDTITKMVDTRSLDEADTAVLVEQYTLKAPNVPQPQRCFELMMHTIWPRLVKPVYITMNSGRTTDPVPPSMVETLAEHALGLQTSPTNVVNTCKIFEVTDFKCTMAIDDDCLIIEKEGRAVSLSGRLSRQFPIARPGESGQNSATGNSSDATIGTASNATQTSHSSTSGSPTSDATVNTDTGNNATQSPSASASQSSGQGSSSASASTPNPTHHFTRNIRYFPMPSGRELKRTHAFTEVSLSGAQTIVLGPMPPPTLPLHVQSSTLPPGHPPQSYGPGAFPPFYNLPGTSSGITNSGATSAITEEVANTSDFQPVVSAQSPDFGASSDIPNPDTTSSIAEEVASASDTQPVASAPSPDSSDNSRKRSRDDEDDEEERDRPTARLYVDAPTQSSLPEDTTTRTAPVAPSPSSAPSGNGEGSSNSGSPRKRSRDAEEDAEEIARPSSRTRQESPAVRSRHPSPTPSDRRIGRIIAPFGTSIRLSTRSSAEADIGSSGAVRNEGNSPVNSPASPSGSSPSVSLSSPEIEEQKANEVSKED